MSEFNFDESARRYERSREELRTRNAKYLEMIRKLREGVREDWCTYPWTDPVFIGMVAGALQQKEQERRAVEDLAVLKRLFGRP